MSGIAADCYLMKGTVVLTLSVEKDDYNRDFLLIALVQIAILTV